MRVRAALWGAEKKIKRARQQTARPPEEGGLQARFMGLANPSLQFIDTAPCLAFRISRTPRSRTVPHPGKTGFSPSKFSGAGAISNSHCILVSKAKIFVLSKVRSAPLLLVVAVHRLVLIEIPESPHKGWDDTVLAFREFVQCEPDRLIYKRSSLIRLSCNGRPGIHRAGEAVLQGTGAIVERCETDSVPRSNGGNLVHPFRGDKSSSLGEWLEPAFQGQRHCFEQTSMHHIRKRMAIQNSAKIRSEPHSAGDLSQTSKEYLGTGHLGAC